jgi:hypothetical protein
VLSPLDSVVLSPLVLFIYDCNTRHALFALFVLLPLARRDMLLYVPPSLGYELCTPHTYH